MGECKEENGNIYGIFKIGNIYGFLRLDCAIGNVELKRHVYSLLPVLLSEQ